MKLFEFEAKNILRKYGILVAKGNIASKPEKVATIAREIGKPVVVKSQILVSSRGKSGGIVFANDATEAKEIVQHISQAGMGQTTCIGLGGDAIVGLDFIKVLGMFKDDEETTYYIALINDSGHLKLITVPVGRPHSSFFPAPNLAVRYGFTPQ